LREKLPLHEVMNFMMKLPDDVFKQELLQYLALNDVIMPYSACVNNEFRPQLLDKLSGVIFIGDGKDDYMEASLFKWLGLRRIYLIGIFLSFEEDNSFLSSVKNDYVDQFRYTVTRQYILVLHVLCYRYRTYLQ